MQQHREDVLSPSDPALIVRYGNTRRKHCRLDRDVLLIGRAPTCEVALVSPEVAPVHCVLLRTGGSWHLRDLTGRGATRVNGQSITDVVLSDGDIVQIGVFSFEAQLPPAARAALPPSTPQIQRLQQSRRRLARLALRLRRRLQQMGPRPTSLAELERQAGALRSLHRQCEQQLRELEEAEAELCRERRAFEAACAEQRAYLEHATQRLAQRKDEQESPLPEEERGSPPEPPGQGPDRYAAYLLGCRQQQQTAGPASAAARDTVQDNVPRSVYIERDDALEQAAQMKEELARSQKEVELALLLVHQRDAELASLRAEESLSRARVQADSRHDQIAVLRRLRDQITEPSVLE